MADPQHMDADLDPTYPFVVDPDADPDPSYPFYADPGTDFYLMRIRILIFISCGCGPGSDFSP